jgi:uncharacterized coiled-coil protein SlyX
MEAQLQQSIPKKTHQEVVSKMQAIIDGLNAEVERIKGEFQKTTSLNENIANLGSQITSQSEIITSLGQTIGGQSQIIESQKVATEALNSKLTQSTVPVLLYDQTLSKLEELQGRIACMVDKLDYVSVQKRCDELSESLKTMIPREDFLNLQNQFVNFVPRESFEALQRTLSQYVPRDQLVASETRVHELEARLENYVPRSDYEELTARIALLAKEASALSVEVVPTSVETQQAAPRDQSSILEILAPQSESARIPSAPGPVSAVEQQPSIPQETTSTAVVAEQPTPGLHATVETPISEAGVTEVPEPANPMAETITASPTLETTEAHHAESIVENRVDEVAVESQIVEPVVAASAAESIVETLKAQTGVESPTVTTTEAPPQKSKPEITEIQSQLSEIKGAEDSGSTTIQTKRVDSTLGFVFANTSFCARSGLEFLQDLERTPIETIQTHMMIGDFERWFKDVLADDTSAQSLKSIREGNFEGEALRAKIVAVIAPRYKS